MSGFAAVGIFNGLMSSTIVVADEKMKKSMK
jgi:hypothetical protein